MTKESDSTAPSFNPLTNLSLGKNVEYKSDYDPNLLQAVPRSLSRDQIGLGQPLPFKGVDVWYGYELSWLNLKGKPQVAILRCEVPYDSPNLIESKSFKLYLNSFNQFKVECKDIVENLLAEDLSNCAGKAVKVTLFTPDEFDKFPTGEFKGACIDELDVSVDDYYINSELLSVGNNSVKEVLTSHLLKSNCLITNQPDWASVQISYEGPKIDHEGLLKYLISFRMHNEFHEQCVERIFTDILKICRPDKLSVYARYTRRGGVDINPYRSNFEAMDFDAKSARQ